MHQSISSYLTGLVSAISLSLSQKSALALRKKIFLLLITDGFDEADGRHLGNQSEIDSMTGMFGSDERSRLVDKSLMFVIVESEWWRTPSRSPRSDTALSRSLFSCQTAGCRLLPCTPRKWWSHQQSRENIASVTGIAEKES